MAKPAITQYYEQVTRHVTRLYEEEASHIRVAAQLLAAHVKADRLIYIYGPGGHSNLAAQEVFFRAGSLMNFSAILDEGTLLSSGALRSMAIERMPAYSDIVLRDYGLSSGDLLILVNAYGINSAVVGAALWAKDHGLSTIGVTSVRHAQSIPADHPARHPSKHNLFELVDLLIDSKVEVGDAVVEFAELPQRVAAMSTIANVFLLNCLLADTVEQLVQDDVVPPVWVSGNAPGGDEANATNIEKFKGRVKLL